MNRYRYQYNGKEFNDELGLNLLDYHARGYDPAIARFNRPDPFSEKYTPLSPYVYALNNPVNVVDPDGRDARVLYDKESNTITIQSKIYITGKGASKDAADKLNKEKGDVYKDGKSEDGTNIKFDVTYEYTEDKNATKDDKTKIEGWQDGDNLLEYKFGNERSNVSRDDKAYGEVFIGAVSKGYEDQLSTSTLSQMGTSQSRASLHETGHFLGLKDRYTDQTDPKTGKVLYSKPNDGYQQNLMGKSSQNGINQQQFNNWNSYIKDWILPFNQRTINETFEYKYE